MRFSRLAIFAACSFVALGCDPSFSVTGTVVDSGSGTEIEGAEIRVTCGKIAIKVESDAAGKFDAWGSTGIVPKDPCMVVVDKAGYVSSRPSVDECTSQWTDCRRELGRIELDAK